MKKETFGNILQTLRLKAGYTSQRAFARAAGIPHMTLVTIESGISKIPKTETLKKIAAALDISLEDLLARSQPIGSHVFNNDVRHTVFETDAIIAKKSDYKSKGMTFKAENELVLLRMVSMNLESFNIYKDDFLSVFLEEEVRTGGLCALERKNSMPDQKEFCIRRKVAAESLTEPGKKSICYTVGDLRRFDLIIHPQNVNYSCIGYVSDQTRSWASF